MPLPSQVTRKFVRKKIDVIAIMAGNGQMDPTTLDKILNSVVEERSDYSNWDRLSYLEYGERMTTFRHSGNIILAYLMIIASSYLNISYPQYGYTAISHRALQKLDSDGMYIG